MRRWEQSGNVSKMLVFGPNTQGKDCAEEAEMSPKIRIYILYGQRGDRTQDLRVISTTL